MTVMAYQFYLERHPEDTEARAFLRRGTNPGHWLSGGYRSVMDIGLLYDHLTPSKYAYALATGCVYSLANGVPGSERPDVLNELANDPDLPEPIRYVAKRMLSRL